MDLFRAAVNTASNVAQKAQGYVSQWTKEERLKKNIIKCSYIENSKWVIEKAIKQVFHVYPKLDCDILSFMENNYEIKLIEIKGMLDIEAQGMISKVEYCIMIPNGFPKMAPYVRIVNPSGSFFVHPFYQDCRSKTDPNSYLLNQKLHQIKNWNQKNSLVNVIIQSHDIMRSYFPFHKTDIQAQINQQNKRRPPIPFTHNKYAQKISIPDLKKETQISKKYFHQLNGEHKKAIPKIQALQITKTSLQSQEEYLRHQNMRMMSYLQNHQDKEQDMISMVRAKDEISEQIIDIVSSIKSRQECVSLLEKKFDDEEIQFEQFLKNVKKIEEQKFFEKVLLSKCLGMKAN